MESEELLKQLVNSVRKHRSIKALFYKPTCVVAVCDLLDRGHGMHSTLSAEDVLAEFSRIVEKVAPERSNMGWMPMWHLTTDNAWVCKKNGRVTSKEAFFAKKPKSRGQALASIELIDFTGVYHDLWQNNSQRAMLRDQMRLILLDDEDQVSNLLGKSLSVNIKV